MRGLEPAPSVGRESVGPAVQVVHKGHQHEREPQPRQASSGAEDVACRPSRTVSGVKELLLCGLLGLFDQVD